METEVTTSVDLDSKLDDWHNDIAKRNRETNIRMVWAESLYRATNGEVSLPYDPSTQTEYVTVQAKKVNEDGSLTTDYDKVDVEATEDILRCIVRHARKLGHGVTKDYKGDEFVVTVYLDGKPAPTPGKPGEYAWYRSPKARYVASRNVVCEKKVVGVEEVPAVPATTREVYDWDCRKVSFLGEPAPND
jgi:hypothetical protein